MSWLSCLGCHPLSPGIKVKKYSFTYFTEEEKDLNDTVIFYSRRGFPFTDMKLRKLAYELAVANKRKGFSPVKKCAGPWWLKSNGPCLRKRMRRTCHFIGQSVPMLSKWPSSSTCTKSLINKFQLAYKPFNIWNIDETGIPDIPKEQRVIGVRGESCSQTVSGEKPANTTLLTFVSAGGLSVPSMIIFKGSKVETEARDAAPSGYMA